MNPINLNTVVDHQINKFHRKFTISEIKKKIMERKESALEITFQNGKIISNRLDHRFKENRKKYLETFLEIVAHNFPEINTTIYCNVNDWSCREESEYPIFVMSAHDSTKNLLLPDYLFLKDYSKSNGRNKDRESQDKIIEKYRNTDWQKKESKCFFRAGTSKNKVIIKMFENHPLVDAKWTNEHFMSYEKMFQHKYCISHFMRWDSFYLFLKSNIIIFLYQGFKQHLWYQLFLQNDRNYLGFETVEEFDKKFRIIEQNPELARRIVDLNYLVCSTFFNYNAAVNYVGKLLLKYQKLITTMSLVSVIIPTYNRFDILLRTIESVKKQTYENVEIIVVNDRSTDERYYEHEWDKSIKVIHLQENSRKKFGYACAAYVRDMGFKESSGDYICFLDDDDYFLPHKIEKQLAVMNKYDFCATEAWCGRGTYDDNISKKKMNQEHFFEFIKNKYQKNNIDISKGYPTVFDLKFIDIHNCIICSSVMVKRSLINEIGMMPYLKNGQEDYSYWKKILEKKKCRFLKEPCLYYDLNSGHGKNY